MDTTNVGFVMNQAMLASIVVWIIQRLKAWPRLTWITPYTDKITRSVGLLLAALSSSGILVVTNWNGIEGTFSMAVSGLTAANVGLFAWTVSRSMVMQEVIYRIFKTPKPGAAK